MHLNDGYFTVITDYMLLSHSIVKSFNVKSQENLFFETKNGKRKKGANS